MATNKREYMQKYMATKRAHEAGLNTGLAWHVYRELKRRGLESGEITWCMIDCAGRGVFGQCADRVKQNFR